MNPGKEIEEIIKDKFESFSPEVPDSVWTGIQQKMNTSPPPTGHFFGAAKIGTIVFGALTVALSIWVIGNVITSPQNIVEGETTTKTTVEATNSAEQGQAKQKETKVVSVETSNSWEEIKSPTKVRVKTITNSFSNSESTTYESVADMHITQNSRRILTLNDLEFMMSESFGVDSSAREESMTVIVENPEINGAPFATINASVVGGNAPLEIMFTQHSSSGNLKWVFGDGETSSKESPTHLFTDPGTYTVSLIVENEKGAIAMDEKTIEVTARTQNNTENKPKPAQITFKPNVFTPNGDGINDFMQVGAENMDVFHFILLDLNTNKVLFETSNPAFKWNGSLEGGTTINKGTYIYIIRAKGLDGRLFDESGPLSVQ